MAKARQGSAAKKGKKTVKKKAAKKAARRGSARRTASAPAAASAAIAARSLSVGPIWRAIGEFEAAARAVEPQPQEIADALASLEKAKPFIPMCKASADAEFEFILLK